MIQEYARLARPYFVLLAIVAIGRWLIGTAFAVPYEKGTNYLSIVWLTLFASLFSAMFTRRWLDWRLPRAAGLSMFQGLVSQVVILLLTALSYGLGISSYFNEPIAVSGRAVPLGFAAALGFRAVGLVVNTIVNGIAGSLGWALGGLLPIRQR